MRVIPMNWLAPIAGAPPVLMLVNAYAMIGRRAAAAGIVTKLGNHSLPGSRDHRSGPKFPA